MALFPAHCSGISRAVGQSVCLHVFVPFPLLSWITCYNNIVLDCMICDGIEWNGMFCEVM